MPAYFSLDVIFKRKDIYETFMQDFYKHLAKCGFIFKSGCFGDESLPFEEIISWNRKKLEENFHLGMDEHYLNDYKQVVFDYHSFSEVRCILFNNYPASDEFTFSIIIPESDLITDFSSRRPLFNDDIEIIKETAKALWEFPCIQSIQTGTEGSDLSFSMAQIERGNLPLAEAFAIIPKTYMTKAFCRNFIQVPIPRDGVYLEPKPISIFNRIFRFLKMQ